MISFTEFLIELSEPKLHSYIRKAHKAEKVHNKNFERLWKQDIDKPDGTWHFGQSRKQLNRKQGIRRARQKLQTGSYAGWGKRDRNSMETHDAPLLHIPYQGDDIVAKSNSKASKQNARLVKSGEAALRKLRRR